MNMITKTQTKTQTKTKTTTVIGLLMGLCLLMGCESQNTYSKLREKEKQTISDYIAREGINVINELPATGATWGEKDYYAVPYYDDLYIHFVLQNTAGRQVKAGDKILTRYKKYGLTSYSDTTRYWDTDDGGMPLEFQLGNTSDTYYVIGWTVAMSLLQYSGSQCRIICPSKTGFSDDNSSVTPYGYELKFNIKP